MHLKKGILVCLYVLICWIEVSAQSIFFQFDKMEYKAIASIEKSFNSIPKTIAYKISISDDYIPNGKELKNLLAQPLVFNRPDTLFTPPPEVTYYFLSSDSTVKLIEYTWDTRNNIKNLNDLIGQGNNQSNREGDYNKKFDEILSSITKYLGKPTKGSGEAIEKEEEGYGKWMERRAEWHNKKVNVELFMIWTPSTKSIGTYKIRTKIYWN